MKLATALNLVQPILLLLGAMMLSTAQIASSTILAKRVPRHIVLIYTDAREKDAYFSPENFVPLAAFVDKTGKPVDKFFDGFLFIGLDAPSGRGLYPGWNKKQAIAEDFTWFLSRLFEEKKQIYNLDSAISSLPKKLQQQTSVIITIPYPDKNLSFSERTSLVEQYINHAINKFQMSKFEHLSLSGFYWINETVPENDVELVKTTAKLVHAKGSVFYWIPYFNAERIDQWRTLGFDYVMLQPNYAFRNVEKERFLETELKRRQNHINIEMELALYTRGRPESPAWENSFFEYLDAALKYKWINLPMVGYYYANAYLAMVSDTQKYPYYQLVYKLRHGTLTKSDITKVKRNYSARTPASKK
jgi:hypothetical protein